MWISTIIYAYKIIDVLKIDAHTILLADFMFHFR